MKLVNGGILVAACGLAVTPLIARTRLAHAQSAGAEALFREGRRLIKDGKIDQGCAKLAASEKLESSVGTLLNLGDCREKMGQYATAWAAFRKAEAMAKRASDDDKRELEARRRAERLEPNLSNIVIQVGRSTPPGLVIKRDQEALDAAVLGTPVPVDPGPHVIVAEAPGYKPFRTEVSLGKGGRRFVVIPTLERLPEPIATSPAPSPIVVAPAPEEPSLVVETTRQPAAVTQGTWSPMRTAAVGIGVIGLGAVGGGLYFGQQSSAKEADANAICPDVVCADANALRLNDEAQKAADRANIFLLAGGAAVVTATVLWFVGQPDQETVLAPAVGDRQVGAALVGTF
jgi:hypothetical protein